jgi:hypothetical protein
VTAVFLILGIITLVAGDATDSAWLEWGAAVFLVGLATHTAYSVLKDIRR